MVEWKSPVFDKTKKIWFVEELNLLNGKREGVYEFYSEEDALGFYHQNMIRQEFTREL